MRTREWQGQPFHLQDQNINSLHCTLYIPYNVSFKNSVSNQALSPLSCFCFFLSSLYWKTYLSCLRNFLLPTPGSKKLRGWEHIGCTKPFNSHEWQRENFSLQYQCNINQMSDENKEKYQFGDNKLTQYKILQTNIIRIVWLTVRRMTNFIWELKG